MALIIPNGQTPPRPGAGVGTAGKNPACKHCKETGTALRVLDLCEHCYVLLVIEPLRAEARRLEESLVIVRNNEFERLKLLGEARSELAKQTVKHYVCHWCGTKFVSMLHLVSHETDGECKVNLIAAKKGAKRPGTPRPRRVPDSREVIEDMIDQME